MCSTNGVFLGHSSEGIKDSDGVTERSGCVPGSDAGLMRYPSRGLGAHLPGADKGPAGGCKRLQARPAHHYVAV